MAFRDYKDIAQALQKFHITYDEDSFVQIAQIQPPQPLLDDLQFNIAHIDVFASEASRRENIIYPVLREIYKSYTDSLALWSHKLIKYDDDLRGAPDYMISTKSVLGKKVLGYPLLIIVEAKRNDFEYGWGQCLAELVAAQRLNQRQDLAVYGIVTDGEVWQFGKLLQDSFIKDELCLTISEMEKIFGAVAWLLNKVSIISNSLRINN